MESIILKLLDIYTKVQQISEYIILIDDEHQLCHCQRKKLPCDAGSEPKKQV